MSGQLVSAAHCVAKIAHLAIFLVFSLVVPTQAQLPWTEDFSNNNLDGVQGSCGTTAPSCAIYQAPTEWSLSGNFSGLNNGNDWFVVYYYSSQYGYMLEARDVDNEVCYTSNTITLSSATNIDLEVDLVEWGNLESNDYVEVSIIVDGSETIVETVSDDFGLYTVQATGIPVSNTVAVKVCMDNNHGSEYQALYEIRITEACDPPVALCQDITVDMGTSSSVTITGNDVDNGSSADCGINSLSVSPSTFTCNDIGDNTVTLTVTDNSGNTATCTSTVTVIHDTAEFHAPEYSSCPSDVTYSATNGTCGRVVTYTTPTATDVVNGFAYENEECFWDIDEQGDSDIDFSSAPTSITMTSADDGPYGYYVDAIMTKTMPCDVTISFDWDYTQLDEDSDAFWDPFGYYLNGTYTDLTDPNVGNQSGSETFTLSAGDVWGLYQSTYDGLYLSGITVITNFTSTESVTLSRTGGLPSGSTFPVGTTTVTYSATDCSNNETLCSFDITITDDEDPTITCPSDQNVDYDADCEYTLMDYSSLATTDDNCDTDVTVSQSPLPGTVITSTTTITLTATDDYNNTATCTFDIIPEDNTAPSVSCRDITIDLTANPTTISPSDVYLSGSDNCGSVTLVSVSPNAFNCDDIGANTVTLTVNDGNGNTNTCTATVTVNDPGPLDVNNYLAETCSLEAGSINLDSYYSDVTTETGTLVWYHDAGRTNPVAGTPPVVSVNDGDRKYFEFTESTTGCQDNGHVEFDVDIIFCILPVELHSFTGAVQNCDVLLEWVTEKEENASHFIIEKSSDGENFQKLSTIPAAGNSNIAQQYSFLDDRLNTLNNYYRLKLYDVDGTFEYSEILFFGVDCFEHGISEVKLYPNPVKNKDFISITFRSIVEKENILLKIYNLQGTLMREQIISVKEGRNNILMHTSDLPGGNYLLNIGEVQYKGVIKPFVILKD